MSGDREHSDIILERLLTLHPKLIDLSLARMTRLLEALGNPERALPPVVHVAGTNGKGSVLAFLRATIEAAGQTAHVYISPHLTRFHERVRLAGKLIDEGDLADLLSRAETANADAPITFFEITTAAAMLGFAETPADWTLLETGLGGRLDATNVVPEPKMTVITSISLDHQEFLGDSLAKIATEKAGILRPGVPCVVAPQPEEAMRAIEQVADRVGAPLYRADAEWRFWPEHGGLAVEHAQGMMDLPAPRLLGRHQLQNAAIAAMALRLLGFEEPEIRKGLAKAEWPARLQRLRSGTLPEIAPEAEIWLDGGHNPGAAEVVAEQMASFEESASAPLFLIFGMIRSKDPAAYLRAFKGLARRVFAVPIPGEPAALAPETLAAAAISVGLPAQTAGSVESAVRSIATDWRRLGATPSPRILICGSLYLAGRVLRDNM